MGAQGYMYRRVTRRRESDRQGQPGPVLPVASAWRMMNGRYCGTAIHLLEKQR